MNLTSLTTAALRALHPGQHTVYTSPDGLPYPGPDDYGDPADAPLALNALANATQAALNKRTSLTGYTSANIALSSGWAASAPFGPVRVVAVGRVGVLSGMLTRTSDLTVDDNENVRLGTVPTPFRPSARVIGASGYSSLAIPANTRHKNACQIYVMDTGELYFTPTMDAKIVAGGADWVSIAGVAFLIDPTK